MCVPCPLQSRRHRSAALTQLVKLHVQLQQLQLQQLVEEEEEALLQPLV